MRFPVNVLKFKKKSFLLTTSSGCFFLSQDAKHRCKAMFSYLYLQYIGVPLTQIKKTSHYDDITKYCNNKINRVKLQKQLPKFPIKICFFVAESRELFS